MAEMLSKKELRKEMRLLRRKISVEGRRVYSEALCERILSRSDVQAAIAGKGVFAAYLASQDEIDLSLLVRRLWDCGCKVVVPAWREGAYSLLEYSPETNLIAGPMGILEPEKTVGLELFTAESEVSVWIVPGLAFSLSGARLGYGGGWYDRFLANAAPGAVSIGVAYPFQIIDSLPLESHDLPLSDIAFGNRIVGEWRS